MLRRWVESSKDGETIGFKVWRKPGPVSKKLKNGTKILGVVSMVPSALHVLPLNGATSDFATKQTSSLLDTSTADGLSRGLIDLEAGGAQKVLARVTLLANGYQF